MKVIEAQRWVAHLALITSITFITPVTPQCGENHVERLKKRRHRTHAEMCAVAEERAQEAAYGPGSYQSTRAYPRGLLRQRSAFAAGCEHRAGGCAHDYRDALGEEL